MKLVIVESASKTKTIQKYLGSDYKVLASLGHVMNFPAKGLGIDTDNWDLTYEPIQTKLKTIKQLKDAVKSADEVLLASDPDREGEAIAWHLANLLKLNKPKRILFHEITKKAILDAVAKPTTINTDLVAAQQSRQTLDRLVGWKMSPLLWKRFTNSHLSAGRVQSVALKALVERFNDYEKHEAEKFWNIEGVFHIQKEVETDLFSNGKKVSYATQPEATKLLSFIQKKKPVWTASIEFKKALRNPSPPFTTSALQQEVYETFKIPAKETMKIAQTLYEQGFITYMRTDSTNLSKDAVQAIQTYLDEHHPKLFQERTYKSKVANAQEAHEAIRPTQLDRELSDLTPSQKKIYDLIWRRAISSQAVAAEYTEVIIHISTPALKEYTFIGKLSYVNKLGYLTIWKPQLKEEHTEIAWWKTNATNQEITATPLKFVAKGNITKPEGLYNEPSLIKWMEKEGIGRPSTYASIVDKLFERSYVTKGANPLRSETLVHITLENNKLTETEEVINRGGTETDRFVPTSLGVQIAEYIESVFPKMMDYKFTSELEDKLDAISRKEIEKNKLLSDFYKELLPVLETAEKQRKKAAANPKPKEKKTTPTTNIIKSYAASIDLITTRYGPALYHKETKKYISVVPFLTWRKLELTDLSQQDVTFLTSLPITVDASTTLEYGRYGLYLKKDNKNIRLPKPEWDDWYTKYSSV